jgi:hypothetical protein
MATTIATMLTALTDQLTGDGADATEWASTVYLARLQDAVNLVASKLPELLLDGNGALGAVPTLTLGGNWPWDAPTEIACEAYVMHRFYLRDSEDERDAKRAAAHYLTFANFCGVG